MRKFSEWLALREMEVDDDAGDNETGMGHWQQFKRGWNQNVVAGHPALRATAIASTGKGVLGALNQAIYGQSEPQGMAHVSRNLSGHVSGAFQINVDIPVQYNANWPQAKVALANKTAQYLREFRGYDRFDWQQAMVSRQPQGRQPQGTARYLVHFAPKGMGTALQRGMAGMSYEALFDNKVLDGITDNELRQRLRQPQGQQPQGQQPQGQQPQGQQPQGQQTNGMPTVTTVPGI